MCVCPKYVHWLFYARLHVARTQNTLESKTVKGNLFTFSTISSAKKRNLSKCFQNLRPCWSLSTIAINQQYRSIVQYTLPWISRRRVANPFGGLQAADHPFGNNAHFMFTITECQATSSSFLRSCPPIQAIMYATKHCMYCNFGASEKKRISFF